MQVVYAFCTLCAFIKGADGLFKDTKDLFGKIVSWVK